MEDIDKSSEMEKMNSRPESKSDVTVPGNETNDATNIKQSSIETCISPLLAAKNPLPPSPTLLDRIFYSVKLPPHGILGTLLTYTVIVLTIWMTCYSVFGQIALPGYQPFTITIQGGTVFALIVLVVVAWVGGWIVQQARLPPLHGMLIVGIILKNAPYIAVARGLDPAWSAALRSTALAVILLRAGLGLDPAALKQLSAMVFRYVTSFFHFKINACGIVYQILMMGITASVNI